MGTKDLVPHLWMWHLRFVFAKFRLPCVLVSMLFARTVQHPPLSWLSSPTQKVSSKPKLQSLTSLLEQRVPPWRCTACLLRGR